MGYHIIVSEDQTSRERNVELLEGPIDLALEQNLLPGAFRGSAKGEKILYVEFMMEGDRSRRRLEWLKTPAGRATLDKALEADARGECACKDLIAGPDRRGALS